MKTQDYTYAVSRIRMKETKLFSSKIIERLISQKDYQSVLRTLAELGFGSDNPSADTDIISAEQKKLWDLMAELVDDMSVFDVFRLQNDYHNLKVAVKSVYSDSNPESMFMSGGTLDAFTIYNAIKNREYKELPHSFSDIAASSIDTLLKTGDGQLCDTLIDKACLEAISSLAKVAKDDVIRDYAELFVASSNIKIAVRGAKLNKSYEFFMNSLAECPTINKELLAKNSVKGFDEICSYLLSTKYKASVEFIKSSMSAFEKWCDNLLINGMKKQKYEPFSVGPLVAYILAKQNEIKAVRLILIAKLNGLNDSKISERVRDMYV